MICHHFVKTTTNPHYLLGLDGDGRSNKAQKLTKWEGIYVTSVAFNYENSTEASTKVFILFSV